jgi:hypothetical protein
LSPLTRRVRTLAALPKAERELLLRALTLLWLCRLALWLLPFPVVTRWADRSRVVPAHAETETRQLVHAIRTASRFVPYATCLVRALAGARLFTEGGQCARVVIGTRKRAEVLEAHAWLESGGQVVLGNVTDLRSYHPLGQPEGC